MQTTQKIKVALCLLAVLLVLPWTTQPVYGQTNNNLSVSAIIPDNQIDTRQTYFDLYMQPGQQQTIQIVLKNSASTDTTARVQINAASTGRNGSILYNIPDIRDETMRVSITDLASLSNPLIHIPANGSQTVDIQLKMPPEEFNGTVLGGITIAEEGAGGGAEAHEGVTIKNKFIHVIGLKLVENNHGAAPDFDLFDIVPSLVNYKTAVTVRLQNKAPLIVKGMAIDAKITKPGSNIVLHNLSLANADMAPNSLGAFVIDWDSLAFSAGVYRLQFSASYLGETWFWDEEFTIGSSATNLNRQGIGIRGGVKWSYYAIGLFALIAVGYTAYRFGKRKAQNGE